MSFLLKKRNIFLFVFLFFIVIQPSALEAETYSGWGDAGAWTSGKYTQDEAGAVVQAPSREKDDGGWGDWVMSIMEGIAAAAIPLFALGSIPFGFIAFMLSSLALGMAAFGIDLALEIGVNLMSSIVHSPADPIKSSWLIFRNLANVGIIFTILFIAIKTILRMDGFDQKFLLGKVIIAALLINFSFLFGSIVIDVSNVMALEIYKKVAAVTNGDQQGDKAKLGSFMYEHAKPAFFQSAIAKDSDPNTEKIFDESFQGSSGEQSKFLNFLKDASLWSVNVSLGYIMGTIANLVLAVVLYIGIFMIYARVIILLFLLVVSPLAFAGMILPSTQKHHKEWWESLVGQSFFLPAFLLFILVGVKIVEKLPEQQGVVTSSDHLQLGSIASYAEIFTPVVFKYLMIIGIFAAALMAAKRVQGMGSAAVGKISASITSATGGAVSAGGAWLGRNTVGAGANLAADKFSKTGFAQTRAGMAILDSMKGVAKNSFDTRNSRIFKGVASATGVGGDFAGTLAPAKDGYIGQQERAEKERIRMAGNLSNDLSDAQKADAERRKEKMDDILDNDTNVVNARTALGQAEDELATAKKTGDTVAAKAAQTKITAEKKAVKLAEDAVRNSNATYIAEKEALDSISSARKKYAQNLQTSAKGWRKATDGVIAGAGGVWVPGMRSMPGQRSADRKAAEKIMKEKSESEKLLDKLREMTDK